MARGPAPGAAAFVGGVGRPYGAVSLPHTFLPHLTVGASSFHNREESPSVREKGRVLWSTRASVAC